MIYFLPLLAVLIGYLTALFLKPENPLGLKLLLAFSGAYLLAVTVFEFLPDIYASQNPQVGIFIMCGILLQIILEFFSKGAEHGHLHHNKNTTRFPWLLFVSLCIHSLLEGFPLNDREHLLHGVVLHKVPVAIILATFLLNSQIGKTRAILFLLVFGLMTPLGSFLSGSVDLIRQWEVYLNSVVIGIFLHISTTIIFEASKNHKFNAGKLVAIVAGILIAYFV